MNDFVWILPADKNPSFGNRGISSSYIIPHGDMKVPPETLSGRRMWTLLRGQDDRALLSFKIKKIERIIEGYYSGDFLVSVDLLSSFRLVEKYSEANIYTIKTTAALGIGVFGISTDEANNLSQMVIQNIEVRIAEPDIKIFSDINTKILPRSGQSLARASLRLMVSYLNLNQIWAQGGREKLGAFAYFANKLITTNVSAESCTGVAEILKSLDPISNLLMDINNFTGNFPHINFSSPMVDIDFTEVKPEKIYARQFISFGDSFQDIETALKKTEHAEKIHQEMLRDIAEFLISKGIVPYESGSIDLMYQSKDRLNVFEIKSSTSDNFLSQSSKGAFQLTCYLEELSKYYDNTVPKLILKSISNDNVESYAKRILMRMNIPVLFYDPNKTWPQKVSGLLS